MQKVGFEIVTEFENKIAEFFGAPYAVATDSCTSGLELCLRYTGWQYIECPKHTYLSVAMLAKKLNIGLNWSIQKWEDYYFITNKIVDAAVLWKRNSYMKGTMMCVSMQYQKHLSVGRLGVILLDNKEAAIQLKKMSYDGRLPQTPWREQDIDTMGYHYYAQIELCNIALSKLSEAIATEPRKWSWKDYPDISQMKVFKK